MIKIYDFLYYCFYCLVIKKPNDQSHVRALMLQGILLVNYLMNLLFFIILIFNIDLSKYKVFLWIIPLIYFAWGKLENKYYLDNGRYKVAIEKYDHRYSKPIKKTLGVFALILFFSSTALFIWIGIKIGKQVRPY